MAVNGDFRVKTRELRSLYKQAWMRKYAIDKGLDMDDEDNKKMCSEAYTEHRKADDVDGWNYRNLMFNTSNILLTNDIKWEDIKSDYYAVKNPATDMSVASSVLSDLYEDVRNDALAEARDGNWNTINDQYLTDEERSDIALREQEDKEYL